MTLMSYSVRYRSSSPEIKADRPLAVIPLYIGFLKKNYIKKNCMIINC